MRKRLVALWIAAATMALSAPAAGQLYGGMTQRAPHGPVNVWFGTARDAQGRYLQGVTVVLKTSTIDFVAVTNRQGRFRLELPIKVKPPQVTVGCSRKGFRSAKITRRLPRGGAASPLEVTCTLK